MISKRLKLYLFVFAAVLVLAIVAGTVFYIQGPKLIKNRLQEQVTTGLGKKASFRCQVEISLVPLGFSFSDLILDEGEQELLKAESGMVILDWWSLIGGESRIERFEIKRPNMLVPLALLEGRKGEENKAASGFTIDRFVVSNGTVRTLNTEGDSDTLIVGLDLELDDVAKSESGELLFSGQMTARELNVPNWQLTEITGTISGNKGHRYVIDNLEALIFTSNAAGQLSSDFSGEHPTWKLNLHSDSFSLDELFHNLAGEKVFTGTVEAGIELSGPFAPDFVAHLNGNLKMQGSDLSQYGFDLDEVIDQLQASRNINLIDIGLFAFAGPLGALAGQGVSYAGLVTAAQSSDQQDIEKLVFNWGIEEGLARTEDVAFRTRENRLAIKGAIDLETAEYKDLSIALLNTQGCALIEQDISGPLTNPVVQKGGMLGSLADSVLGILAQGWRIVDVSECQPYYQGTVKPHGVQQ